MATDFSFTKIFTYNGSAYTDVTLEAMSPAGTAFSALGGTAHFLYLGHDKKFDMAVFDLDTDGVIGTPKWEYTNDSGGWTEFIDGTRIQPKVGSILLFPATWTYVHRGYPTKVPKYIVTGWIYAKP